MTLRQRAPMSRGSGFKRREMPRHKAPPLRRVERSGVYAPASSDAVPAPKENVIVCEAYRRIVRQLPCIRCGIVGFTQFCHSDMGKGMGLKTDDRRGWPGCGPHGDDPGCHWIVGTSGQIPREERRDLEADYARRTREAILIMRLWPVTLPEWTGD